MLILFQSHSRFAIDHAILLLACQTIEVSCLHTSHAMDGICTQ